MIRIGLVVLAVGVAAAAAGQTPRPFPVPPPVSDVRDAGEDDRAVRPAAPEQPASTQQTAAPAPIEAPTEATLGLPVYPNAQFIASYNAGRGQRYYLFGVQASYAEIVAYYTAVLRENGNEVFDEPATHTFEVGRFEEDTMAFPPGVTVKDFSWRSEGFPNPTPGALPARFATVIQIVPEPAGASR